MLVEPSKCLKQIVLMKLNRVKNLNWLEVNQLAFTGMVEDLNSGIPRANPAGGQGGACTWGRRAVTTWPCWLLLIMDNIFLKDLPQWIVSSEMSIRRVFGVGTWELFLCSVPFVFLGFLLWWLICFLWFTSPESWTGSYTEDEPIRRY